MQHLATQQPSGGCDEVANVTTNANTLGMIGEDQRMIENEGA